ncbi:Panacea domain-containing protein [Spiroplasma phoeniceum]|uniref:Antitoxin SocA-like Panacea domain-containing protein n=1 Tax=Spiroplasma phoeniceum P40 TaxID=1276259 RepID=A0A345DLP2_9MOLU|nr:type II toxin-antitoxin system antitoxin SocA domain-containing protein [Spiroplasma phoeniceum]AXF95130.1 hypothetical protein SDAV_00114 [Spiroplasma phoeniceum P40]
MKACKLSEYIIQRIYEDAITQLKLQKSLYFIYVYFLVNKQKKIFNDKFQRWDYGPVIKDVYDKYKKYEKNPIEIPKKK